MAQEFLNRMKSSENSQFRSWFIVVLLCLAGGQLLLARSAADAVKDNPPWLAVMIIVMGALALWLLRFVQADDEAMEDVETGEDLSLSAVPPITRKGLWRIVLLFIALSLTLILLWRIPTMLAQDSYLLAFLGWSGAILLYLAAVANPFSLRYWADQIRSWPWKLTLLVAGIVFLAFMLRYWRVGSIPFTLSGDEASQGLEAVRVLQGELRNPFSTGWLGVPTMSFFFNGLSINALGRTIFALRVPWVLVGTMTVLATFLLVKQMVGTKLALFTAAILSLYHYHIHYSRLGSNQIADPLFLSLSLFFLMRARYSRKQIDWALSGVVCGLAFYVYAGARLTPVVMVAVLAYWILLNPKRFWREYKWGLVIGLLGFLIAAAPMMQYAVRFPGEFNARLNQVGILQSGWLEREVVILDQPAWAILFDQFRRAALAFNYFPDRTVWYGLPEPLLDPFFGGIFLLGLTYGTLQLFNRRAGPRIAPMVAWWWGGMILGGIMTESPPSSQRLITLAVPASFFIAYALWELIKAASQLFEGMPQKAWAGAAVLLFAVVSLYTYFIDYTPQQLYGGRNAELATLIAPRLNELKEDHRIYFVGAPWMYWGFATLPYLVPEAEAGDIIDPLTDPAPENLLHENKGELFIVIPPRFDELEILTSSFPQGIREEVYSAIDGRHMATLFRLAP